MVADEAAAPFHVHMFATMLLTLSENVGEEVEMRSQLKKAYDAYTSRDVAQAHRIAPHCCLRKTFSSKTRKLTLTIRDAELEALVERALLHIGAKPRHGRAPAGAQERAIAKALNAGGAD